MIEDILPAKGEPLLGCEPGTRLSPREVQVLELTACGYSDARIGVEMKLSENTVKTYQKRVFSRLNVSTRASAVSRGYQLGYLVARVSPAYETQKMRAVPSAKLQALRGKAKVHDLLSGQARDLLYDTDRTCASNYARIRKAVPVRKDVEWLDQAYSLLIRLASPLLNETRDV